MKTSQDDDCLAHQPVQHLVGESVQKVSTDVSMNDPEAHGRVNDAPFGRSKFIQEFFTEPSPLRFIPIEGSFDIRSGTRSVN